MGATAQHNGHLLRVRGLSVSFHGRYGHTEAVRNVDFDLQAGHVLGIVGESGSGKSVTLRAIMGLLPETARVSGSIQFDGREVLEMTAEQLRALRGRDISMVFQNPASHLDPLMTIVRQVAEPLEQHEHMARKAARAAAIDRLREVQIDQPERRADSYPHQLSGGMKQRAMIAAAVACRPRLLLADEPTTALDVTVQAHILKLLSELRTQHELGMVFVSHDLAVIAQVCDHILVMKNGEVVEQGKARDIITTPGHPYTRQLIDAQPGRGGSAHAPSELSSSMPPLLELENLAVEFDLPRVGLLRKAPVLRAVDTVSIQLRQGESLGIVGESGSGKSTVARAIMGLVKPVGGRVLLRGQAIIPARGKGRDTFPRNIQMAFQNPFDSLNPRLTVSQTIAEPLLRHRLVPRSMVDARVAELMGLVELDPGLAQRKPGQLSGGQCQRVGIARALAMEPEILIADEVTSALDVTIQAQIIKLLMRLRQRVGLSMIFISHDLALVRSFCQEVAVFRAGKIVEYGRVEAVLDHPQDEYTKTLIASAPVLDVSSKQHQPGTFNG